MSDAILEYDWTKHGWGQGHGGYNPNLVPEWKAMTESLVRDPEGYEATTDGGWPRVGWRKVLAVEMRRTWPYNFEVPSVLLSGWDGAHWHALMSLSEIRYRREPRPSPRGTGTEAP